MNAKIKCNRCGKCCRGVVGPIIFPDDLEMLSDKLLISPTEFIEEYCDKEIIETKTMAVKIYYLKMNDGHCIFQNQNNLCDIYDFRPYQCKNAPFHFMAIPDLWSHMCCISQEDFANANSHEADKKIFRQLIQNGYEEIIERR